MAGHFRVPHTIPIENTDNSIVAPLFIDFLMDLYIYCQQQDSTGCRVGCVGYSEKQSTWKCNVNFGIQQQFQQVILTPHSLARLSGPMGCNMASKLILGNIDLVDIH